LSTLDNMKEIHYMCMCTLFKNRFL